MRAFGQRLGMFLARGGLTEGLSRAQLLRLDREIWWPISLSSRAVHSALKRSLP